MPDQTRERTACYSPGMSRTVWLATLLVIGALALGPPAPVDARECAAIADRSARLQCFTGVTEIVAKVGRVVDGDTMDICIGAS